MAKVQLKKPPFIAALSVLRMNKNELALSVQRALLGEVPPTLRFLYARIENEALYYHAVFTDDATDEHLECANVALTEILADLSPNIQLKENIERNGLAPWRVGSGENLLFLRHGELKST